MIPLIALFICFLAIAGVGVAYAYNSTIQIDDNPVNEQYFTLDYTNETGTAIATVLQIPVDTNDMTITTGVSVADTDGNPATEERTFTAIINKNVNANITREFYVKLASDMGADQKFVITGSVDKSDTVINAIFGTCTFAMKGGNDFTQDVNMASVDAGHVYKVILTISINSNVDVKTLDLANGGNAIVDANTLATALSDLATHTFGVSMSAEPVVATP